MEKQLSPHVVVHSRNLCEGKGDNSLPGSSRKAWWRRQAAQSRCWCSMFSGWSHFIFVKCIYMHVHIHIYSLCKQIYMFVWGRLLVSCSIHSLFFFESSSTLLRFTEYKALKSTFPSLPCCLTWPCEDAPAPGIWDKVFCGTTGISP